MAAGDASTATAGAALPSGLNNDIVSIKTMSLPCEMEVTCRRCHARQPVVFWQSLNASLNPEAREKLLAGSLHRFQCRHCGVEDEVLYTMLYHDMDRMLMIWLVLDEAEAEAKSTLSGPHTREYQFRFVSTRNQLVEKIRIFESKLDDRVVELLKLKLRQDAARGGRPLVGELLFAGVESPSDDQAGWQFTLGTEAGLEIYSVPRSLVEDLQGEMANRLPPQSSYRGQWLRVDEAFVAQWADAPG